MFSKDNLFTRDASKLDSVTKAIMEMRKTTLKPKELVEKKYCPPCDDGKPEAKDDDDGDDKKKFGKKDDGDKDDKKKKLPPWLNKKKDQKEETRTDRVRNSLYEGPFPPKKNKAKEGLKHRKPISIKQEETELDETVTAKHMVSAANQTRAIENPDHRQMVADHFAHFFKGHNPKFDHDKFHRAAGTQSRKE